MRKQDLRPGALIKNGGVVFEVAQANLFLLPTGRVIGGVVYPVREGRRKDLIKGYCALNVLGHAKKTRARLTVY